MKKCLYCHEEKELLEFDFRSDTQKHRNICKKCKYFKAKNWKNFCKLNTLICSACKNSKTLDSFKIKTKCIQCQVDDSNKHTLLNNIKKCTKCKEEKSINDFKIRSDTLKYNSFCQICILECASKRYKKHYENNKKYYENKNKKWQNANPDKVRLSLRKWQRNNKEKINEYSRKRRAKNPAVKIRQIISNEILRALKEQRIPRKENSMLAYLPYSIVKLEAHLESLFEPWMTWENWGVYRAATWDDNDQSTWTWNIDHIIPQSALPYSSMNDQNFKICLALENLRPYSAKLNILKGNKI